jgi:hypothetical protein
MTKTHQFHENRSDENILKSKKHSGNAGKMMHPPTDLPKVGTREYAVLTYICKHFSVTKIASITEFGRTTIQRYLKVMKKQGLVIYTSSSWKPTKNGYKYVISNKIDTPLALPIKVHRFSDNGLSFLIDRSHNFKFKVFVVSKPTNNEWLKNWRPYKLRYTTYYILQDGNITTTYTGKNLIIQMPVNIGENPLALVESAKKTVRRLIKRYESTYGLNLNSNTVDLITQHHAFQNEPFALKCTELGRSYNYEKSICIDASENGIGEYEFIDNNNADKHAYTWMRHTKDIVTNCTKLQSELEEDMRRVKLQLKWDM